MMAAAHQHQHAHTSMASPLPKPATNGGSPAKYGDNTTDAVERTPSPRMHVPMTPMQPMPTPMCPCPTCEYYRAAMMYYHECASPNVDSYTMYQNPMMHMMMPPVAAPIVPVTAPSVGIGHPTFAPPQSSRGNSPVNATPSPATLEAFASNQGQLAELACTSAGRATLQSVLAMEHIDKIELIFQELLLAIETVALDQHGCHVVRSLIEVLDESQVQRFVEAMNETLILNMCTLTQYTRRVLQALFERHKNCDLQPIVALMHRNAQYLSATQQGCISLMRVFEQCSVNQKMMLLEPLRPMLADLACDQFANYVVQCMIEHTPKSVMTKIALESLSGAMLRMALDKFGSNVMEKLISTLQVNSVRRVVLDELVFNPAALQQLVHDGYGNFVVQSIIESCANANEFKKIGDRLRSALPNSPYAHKIENKMRNKRFPTASTGLAQPHMRNGHNHRTPLAAC